MIKGFLINIAKMALSGIKVKKATLLGMIDKCDADKDGDISALEVLVYILTKGFRYKEE